MSNLLEHAKTELDILVKANENELDRPIVEPFIPEILQLVEKFGKSGQSGGSAPYTAHAIVDTLKKLFKYEPLLPITGIEDEWVDVASYNDGKAWFQNKRLHPVFKEGLNGQPYYLDAIIWKEGKNNYFTGTANTKEGKQVTSRQYIKLPGFIPKSFYIDVYRETEDSEWIIKDDKQLEKVYKHYLKPKNA